MRKMRNEIARFCLLLIITFSLYPCKSAVAKEFICKFYCDTGESKLLQTKSKYPIEVKIEAPSAEKAVEFLHQGWRSTRADEICKKYGYKSLYRHIFWRRDIQCEEK